MCRLFQEIITESPEIQYKIELEIAGLTDIPSVRLPIKERIVSLKSYQEAFKSIEVTTICTTLPGLDSTPCYYGDIIFLLYVELDHTRRPQTTLKVCRVKPQATSVGSENAGSHVWWEFPPKAGFSQLIHADPSQDVVILSDQSVDLTGEATLFRL